jgi:tRNA dimethylallyltransferase
MKLIAILGQTSSGKSEIAVEIADYYTQKGLVVWVVNCDSRQVYKDLNIGTGKVAGQWQQTDKDLPSSSTYFYKNIPHFLIDYIEPQEGFDLTKYLSDFKNLFTQKVPDIVILCGGTGLYAKSVYSQKDYFTTKPEHLENYKQLREYYSNLSLGDLQKQTEDLNLNQSDFNNKIRLINQLLKRTATLNDWLIPEQPVEFEESFLFGILTEQGELYQKISDRLKNRIDSGLFEEFLSLKQKNIDPSFWTRIGLEYRLCWFYYYGLISQKEWQSKLLSQNLQYAKRQLTWFKREPLIWKKSTFEILQYLTTYLKI